MSVLFTSVAQAEHRAWHIVSAPDTSGLTTDTQHVDNEIAPVGGADCAGQGVGDHIRHRA